MFNLSDLPAFPDVDDVRAHQSRVALVMAHLLTLALPYCTWVVHDSDGMPLEGQLPCGSRADLQAWADAFGAVVDWQRFGSRFPYVRFRVAGLLVQVWCKVEPIADAEPVSPAQAAPADAPAPNTGSAPVPTRATRIAVKAAANLHDALSAVREALDIPHGRTIGDGETRRKVLNERAMHAVVMLRGLLDGKPGADTAWRVEHLREQLSENPATGYNTRSEATR